jgi:hypothetical protein
VVTDGPGRDKEPLGDLDVGVTAADQAENLALTLGQPCGWRSGDRPGMDRGWTGAGRCRPPPSAPIGIASRSQCRSTTAAAARKVVSQMSAARFAISKAMVAHRAQPRCRDSPIPAATRAMARARKKQGADQHKTGGRPAHGAELMLRACLDAPEPVEEPSGPEQGVAADSCECGSGDEHHGDDADVKVQDLPLQMSPSWRPVSLAFASFDVSN